MFFDLRKIKHIKSGLTNDLIDNLYKSAKEAKSDPATVGKVVNGTYTTEYNKWCTAEFVNYTEFKNTVETLKQQCITIVEREYKVSCVDDEIHFLKYNNGTEYKSHVDGQFIENNVAKRGVDRDITCVVYLNDDYEKGEIFFDFFNLTIKPSKGDIIIYPATWEYKHGVYPVKGERFAIAFWFKTSPELNVESKIPEYIKI